MAISNRNIPVKGTPKPAPAAKAASTPSHQAQRPAAGEILIKEEKSQFPLERPNFIFMAIAGAIIVIGFLLMLGGGTTTESFNGGIFSTRRVVVGPTLSFIGFVLMGVAIIRRPRKEK